MIILSENEYSALFCEIEPLWERVTGREKIFLHDDETTQWERIRAENYRRSWFAARVCAKILWNSLKKNMPPNPDVDRMEIVWPDFRIASRNSSGQGIRPVLFDRDRPVRRELSISHSDSAVLVAFASQAGWRIGVDLVPLGSVTEGMKRLFLSEADLEADAVTIDAVPDRLWAVKEAAYKAGHDRESFAPTQWHAVRQVGEEFFCRNSDKPELGEIRIATRIVREHVMAVAVTTSMEK